jgi:hypothetical protein
MYIHILHGRQRATFEYVLDFYLKRIVKYVKP